MPATGVVPCFKVKVLVLIVDASIASLNVLAICPLRPTPLAVLAGTVALTVGAVVSGATPVVKLQTKSAASALPARSLAPGLILAVYTVLGARFAAGAKVAVTPM